MNYYIFFTVFISGMTTLAAEISALRLLSYIYGTSNIVWSIIIGVIMFYLAIGYYLGGNFADKNPTPAKYYQLLSISAVLTASIPYISQPILFHASQAITAFDIPIATGAFIGTLLIFALPITILGCSSPYAIRLLLTHPDNSGSTAGKVYSLSTAGSIVGSFIPTLLTIPTYGTRNTYLLFGGILLITCIVGILLSSKKLNIASIVLITTYIAISQLPSGKIKSTAGLIYESESAYNLIQVVNKNNANYLLLNEGQGIHSVYNKDSPLTNSTWDYYLAAPYFNKYPYSPSNIENILIIGLAGGTISNQHIEIYPNINITGIEIDPEIIAVGRKYFNLSRENLTIIIGDGRASLHKLKKTKYNVIAVDAYRLPYIPWHLTTKEFFLESKSLLSSDGVLAINVGRTSSDRRLIDSVTSTLLAVFSNVHIIDVPNTYNSLLVATIKQTHRDNVLRNATLPTSKSHPILNKILSDTPNHIVPINPNKVIFTDDKSPIEIITDSILIKYLFEEGST